MQVIRVARLVALASLALLVFLWVSSCDNGKAPIEPIDPPRPTSIVLSTPAVSFDAIGRMLQLTATVRDQRGTVMSGAQVTWSSSSSLVVTVSSSGLINAVGNGEAVITATSGSASGSTVAVVQQAVASISISPDSVVFGALGDSTQVTATATDPNGSEIEDATVLWAAIDPSVVSISSGGMAVGLSRGTSGITATAGQITDTISATVSQVPTMLEVVAGSDQQGRVGEVLADSIAVRVSDRGGSPIPQIPVIFEVTEGGGLVTPAMSLSDETGVAKTAWRLGVAVGENTLTARIATGIANPISLAALTVPPPPVDRITVAPPLMAMVLGGTAQLTAVLFDSTGNVLVGRGVVWASQDTLVAVVNENGIVTAVSLGTVTVTAITDEVTGFAQVVVEEPVSSLQFSSDRMTVDVADSLVFTLQVLDSTGQPVSRSIQWTCSNPWVVQECGEVFRPRFQPMPGADSTVVIASAGGLADTLTVVVFEEEMDRLIVEWGSISTWDDQSNAEFSIQGIVGDRLEIRAIPVRRGPMSDTYETNRPLQIKLASTSLADVTLSAGVGSGYAAYLPVVLDLMTSGESTLTFSVQGASTTVRLVAFEKQPLSCTSSTTMDLDLGLGEKITFRGSDEDRPRCLHFEPIRDEGKQYLVLFDMMPRVTGLVEAVYGFSTEGQGLFRELGAPVPPAYPVVRFFTADIPSPVMEERSRASLPELATKARSMGDWQFGDVVIWEAAPNEHVGTVELYAAAGEKRGDAFLSVGESKLPIAVGDTLVVPTLTATLEGVSILSGGPASDKAVVTYVGQYLVFAEAVDILEGRLAVGERVGRPIPQSEYEKIDSEYRTARVQLDRFFQGPFVGDLAGKGGGGRELVVTTMNAYRRGHAGPGYAAMDYWQFSDGFTPGPAQAPVVIADHFLAHEFAHVRHLSAVGFWEGSWGWTTWAIEGVASFADNLVHAARLFDSDEPPRTSRRYFAPPEGQRLDLSSTESFFFGYQSSAYLFDYITDQVEALGGDGLSAALDLANNASSEEGAQQASELHLGITFDELLNRARTARYVEGLRYLANAEGEGYSGLRPDSTLPDWTAFLQYDVPAMLPFLSGTFDWPAVVHPDEPRSLVLQIRNGGSLPVFIDGTHATLSRDFLIDLEHAPHAMVSVLRIR